MCENACFFGKMAMKLYDFNMTQNELDYAQKENELIVLLSQWLTF